MLMAELFNRFTTQTMECTKTFERKRRIYQWKDGAENARNRRKEDFNFAGSSDLGKYETRTDALTFIYSEIPDFTNGRW